MSQIAVNLEIEGFSPEMLSEVKAIQLGDEDKRFASSVDDFLSSGSEHMHLFIIKLNRNVIGFFKLDISYSSTHPFCSINDIGIRTLALDKRYQGQGLGFLSLKKLQRYLVNHYTNFQYLYLTVNHKNPVAISLYEKAGFEYTGEDYLQGPAGPQHIMRKEIME